jgi:hypothetical protein
MKAGHHSRSSSHQDISRSVQENTGANARKLSAVAQAKASPDETPWQIPTVNRESGQAWPAVLQKKQAGSTGITVAQLKKLTVFLKGDAIPGTKTIQIDVADNMEIAGDDLLRQLSAVITAAAPPMRGKERYFIIRNAGAQMRGDGNYQLHGNETFTFSFDAANYGHAQRSAEAADDGLIDLAAGSNRCIIGCCLFSSPGNREALQAQQALGEVEAALNQNKAFTLTLIDPGFAQGHAGQIVDYLEKNNDVHPVVTVNGECTTHVIGKVIIHYVKKFVNAKTEEVMKERGIGQWYSEIK